ncbi:MAG: LpqB family beta-propeller domain-containing protein [Micrococcales bacterium]
MTSRILKTLSVLVVALVISACAKLPTSPLNQIGPEISSTDTKESLYYSPSGPSKGSTPEQIINGFLYAGNGPQNDYSVAREYLTLNNSSKWHPGSETLIQTGQIQVLSNTGTKIRVLVKYEARVTEDGTYVFEPGSKRILEFRLLQEAGEWRISSAPNLTSVLAPNFNVLFKAMPIYFWDKAFAYLVPDLRWFPTRASLATKLTNAMIAGPNQWLAPAVQNLLPAGTKLNINSVTVESGTASIDFNATALKIPAWKRPYLRSQLVATLGSVEGVTQVSISVERTLQLIGIGASGMPTDGSNLPVVLTTDGLSHLTGSGLMDIRGTKEIVSKQNAKSFAISSDESLVVLLGDKKIASYNLGLLRNSTQLIDDRPSLITPSIDPFNSVWTASAKPGAAIRVTDIIGGQVNLTNPYGSTGVIRALAVSPEGSRLAVLHDVGSGTAVDVFAIVRDKGRHVVVLGSKYPISAFGPNPKTLSWVDNTTLVGLREDLGGLQSLSIQIGGPAVSGRRALDGVAVVTVAGGSQYYLDSNGSLFLSKSFTWDRLRSAVLDLRMTGQ